VRVRTCKHSIQALEHASSNSQPNPWGGVPQQQQPQQLQQPPLQEMHQIQGSADPDDGMQGLVADLQRGRDVARRVRPRRAHGMMGDYGPGTFSVSRFPVPKRRLTFT